MRTISYLRQSLVVRISRIVRLKRNEKAYDQPIHSHSYKQIGPTVWRMYNAKPENQKANSVERKRQHSATIAESNLNRGCLEPLRALGHKEVEEHRGNVNLPCNSL